MPTMTFDGVFEGGGVKGIALIGALKRLEEENILFSRVAGTSAGAITASLFAAGYSVAELKEIIWKKDFNDFADMSLFKQGLWKFVFSANVLRLWSVLSRQGGYGLFSTGALYKWIKGLLKDKGVTDFKSAGRYLRVFAVDIVHQALVRYDQDATPEVEVAEAVRQSMSLPLFFRGRFFKNYSFVVDGGVLANYPIDTFNDRGGLTSTIGLKLISDEQTLPPRVPGNVFAYILRIFETMQVAHERLHVEEAQWARTIPIPTGKISTIHFDLSEEDKKFLWDAGYAAAEKAIQEGLLTPQGRA